MKASAQQSRPIIFSTPMVEALLAGRKTETRRVVKVPEHLAAFRGADLSSAWPDNSSPFGACLKVPCGDGFNVTVQRLFCPYGEPGQVLYVKEAHWRWGRWEALAGLTKSGRPQRAFIAMPHPSPRQPSTVFSLRPGEREAEAEEIGWHLRSPLFLPRSEARCRPELLGARFHRLQEMSEADILSEGVTVDGVAAWCGVPWSSLPSLHDAWRVAWNHINGARQGCSWKENPWVVALRLRP